EIVIIENGKLKIESECIPFSIFNFPFSIQKPYPLRQRQLITPIYSIGLPAHIGLPTVRAAFPPAAGFFFTSEGAADLRTTRTDIHIGNTAITPKMRKELLRLAHMQRHDRR